MHENLKTHNNNNNTVIYTYITINNYYFVFFLFNYSTFVSLPQDILMTHESKLLYYIIEHNIIYYYTRLSVGGLSVVFHGNFLNVYNL